MNQIDNGLNFNAKFNALLRPSKKLNFDRFNSQLLSEKKRTKIRQQKDKQVNFAKIKLGDKNNTNLRSKRNSVRKYKNFT